MEIRDYGLIIGDAMGVPIELPREDNMTDYGTYNQPEGTWSDNCSMVLATLASIRIEEGIDYKKRILWIDFIIGVCMELIRHLIEVFDIE